MLIKLIDNIIINQLGFHTTMHDRCIYRRVRDGETQLLLRQIDDFLCGVESEQSARTLLNNIGTKIQFPTKVEQGIIPFKFLGVVKDYNGVDITQTPDYIEMSCKNYIKRLLKSHGWDTTSKLESVLTEDSTFKSKSVLTEDSKIPLKSNSKTTEDSKILLDSSNTQTEVLPEMELQRDHELTESKELIQKSIIPSDTSMLPSRKISPLPSDCIKQLFKYEGPAEGSNGHLVLEKSSGFSYCTLLGELMYSYVTCRPDIGYAVTTLSKVFSAPSFFIINCSKALLSISKVLLIGVFVFNVPNHLIIRILVHWFGIILMMIYQVPSILILISQHYLDLLMQLTQTIFESDDLQQV